jgi:hypothetical protein
MISGRFWPLLRIASITLRLAALFLRNRERETRILEKGMTAVLKAETIVGS